MFNFGKEKKTGSGTFGFDLEDQIKKSTFREKLEKRIDEHVGLIQKNMREGNSQDNFKKLGAIMQGYLGLQKVLARVQIQHIRGRSK